MFWKAGEWRCRVLVYTKDRTAPRIHVRYTMTANLGGEATLEFVDEEWRDLYLVKLDGGHVNLIDHTTIRGLVS
jgi:hypothetical protein